MKNNKHKKIIFLFKIIGIVLVSILLIKIVYDFCINNDSKKQISYIELYGYELNNNDTILYKEKFNELKSVLNNDSIDYNKYASLLSELFVIDVFTLNNKLTSTDIGGLEFIHSDLKDNFKENMGNTLYKNIESNIDGNREQELPIVKNIINTNVSETKYNYNDIEYDGYLVKVEFEYEKDNDYQNSIELTLIKDNKELFIVKGE